MGSVKHPKFYCRQKPEGWAVCDAESGKHASLGGYDLVSLPEWRAKAACDVLVAIYACGLDAESVRSEGQS